MARHSGISRLAFGIFSLRFLVPSSQFPLIWWETYTLYDVRTSTYSHYLLGCYENSSALPPARRVASRRVASVYCSERGKHAAQRSAAQRTDGRHGRSEAFSPIF
ncbi:hypothetical protein V9T40_004667 [Parthenolecanium corni]|uniref:Secreted protein n=1 Tax=Parthenolecanium corni TaxID=536013 RepID=A0AAN9TEH6_9HEMI